MYRPPNCSADKFTEAIESAEKCLLSLKAPMPSIILMGDLNMPNVDWSNPIVNGQQINILKSFTNRFFIDQQVDKATRNKNILNLIFTQDDLISSITTNYTILSDHRLIIAEPTSVV